MRRIWICLSTLALALTISTAAQAHEIDPTTLDRARREVFPKAESWKKFEREVDAALAREISSETKVKWRGKNRTLEYQVAFSSAAPGSQKDVLGVMLLREIETKSGPTTIAIGVTVRGRIARVRGVAGPDARGVAKMASALRRSTLLGDFDLGEDKATKSIAREAHAVLFATRALLGATAKSERTEPIVDSDGATAAATEPRVPRQRRALRLRKSGRLLTFRRRDPA